MDNIKKPITLLARHDLVMRGIHYCNQHLIFLENIGMFPKRIRLSPQKVFWDASEIEAFLASKSAAREEDKNV